MASAEAFRPFLDEAASKSPTPGGGSVTALVGALGVSMASMSANLTLGKEEFAEAEDRLTAARDAFERARLALTTLVEEDMAVYKHVVAAYKLPKKTDDEKAARTQAIQEALTRAMDVPLRVMRAAIDVLRRLQAIVGSLNPNIISDAGVAAVLCEATVRASSLNVNINLVSLKDRKTRDEAAAEVGRTVAEASALAREILETTRTVMGK